MENDSTYSQTYMNEKSHLEETVSIIRREIEEVQVILENREEALAEIRKEMWNEASHNSSDFEKLTDLNQYLNEVSNQEIRYSNTVKQLKKYKRAELTPYFARFDFVEEGFDDVEDIYIGIHSIRDTKMRKNYVYDWRSPICSIFYQNELGQVTYTAPAGEISGKVLLKRQYKIINSELKYYFDSSIRISDDILQEVLSKNASSVMKNIVETIQKEQDIIIRDTQNELLIVQGVAGSGKTSIALHRIAFLLYKGMGSDIGANNIIIISPNSVFSKYISGVLPELGEENVDQITYDEMITNAFKSRFKKDGLHLDNRNRMLESLILNWGSTECSIRTESVSFKGSKHFVLALDKLISYYMRRAIAFQDVYYNGQIIETRQYLKNRFLDNKVGIPIAKQLNRIEGLILSRIQPLQKIRQERMEKIVERLGNHEFETQAYSRFVIMQEAKRILNKIKEFTEIDYFDIYKLLFDNMELFYKLFKGVKLPENIEKIIENTRKGLNTGVLCFEDFAPLLYIKLRIEGNDLYKNIKQVVIDEAQDYYPIQYEIFNLLFKGAKYTVLGDFQQSIERVQDKSLYNDITEIFDKEKTIKLFLNKSYRSSYEINAFTQKLLSNSNKQDFISFERHEDEPLLIEHNSITDMDKDIFNRIHNCINEGFESVAIICKTTQQAKQVYARMKKQIDVKLIASEECMVGKGIWILSSYMTKGLEFDVVVVYGVDSENYKNEFDRRLLYVSCTRALHRLYLAYSGHKSLLI